LHGSHASTSAAPLIVPAVRAPEAAAAVAPASLKLPTPPSAPAPAVAAPAEPVAAQRQQDPAGAGTDSDDDLPAVDAPRPAPESASSVPRATDSGLPTYQDTAGIPELKLDVHVFDANPANRFVFLNGRSLREGEVSAEGVRVETITKDGVILSYRGRRFVLLSP
jgi:general secretion pathway protein B